MTPPTLTSKGSLVLGMAGLCLAPLPSQLSECTAWPLALGTQRRCLASMSAFLVSEEGSLPQHLPKEPEWPLISIFIWVVGFSVHYFSIP